MVELLVTSVDKGNIISKVKKMDKKIIPFFFDSKKGVLFSFVPFSILINKPTKIASYKTYK